MMAAEIAATFVTSIEFDLVLEDVADACSVVAFTGIVFLMGWAVSSSHTVERLQRFRRQFRLMLVRNQKDRDTSQRRELRKHNETTECGFLLVC